MKFETVGVTIGADLPPATLDHNAIVFGPEGTGGPWMVEHPTEGLVPIQCPEVPHLHWTVSYTDTLAMPWAETQSMWEMSRSEVASGFGPMIEDLAEKIWGNMQDDRANTNVRSMCVGDSVKIWTHAGVLIGDFIALALGFEARR